MIANVLACTDDGLVGVNKSRGEAGSASAAGAAASAPEPAAGTGTAGSVADTGGTDTSIPIDASAVADASMAADAGPIADASPVDAGCTPACGAGQVCDPGAGLCFECRTALDCEVPDECDDCVPSDRACVARYCRACISDDECPAGEPRCLDGQCHEIG